MANNSKSKLKLLYLKRILEEETDESCLLFSASGILRT